MKKTLQDFIKEWDEKGWTYDIRSPVPQDPLFRVTLGVLANPNHKRHRSTYQVPQLTLAGAVRAADRQAKRMVSSTAERLARLSNVKLRRNQIWHGENGRRQITAIAQKSKKFPRMIQWANLCSDRCERHWCREESFTNWVKREEAERDLIAEKDC